MILSIESFLETDSNVKSIVERVLFDISVYVLITLVLSKLCGCRCKGGTIIIRDFDHKDYNTLTIFCFTEQRVEKGKTKQRDSITLNLNLFFNYMLMNLLY